MLFVKFQNEKAVEISTTCPENFDTPTGYWKDRWDWTSHAQVCKIAEQLTEHTKISYIGVDRGPYISPRFDIIAMPQIGDEVSYAFNGDSYPDGVIVAITPTMQIRTSTGRKYRRKKLSGSWLDKNGWSLIHGHVYSQNPHF